MEPILLSCELMSFLTAQIQKIFRGFGRRKGYTAVYVKLEICEFWEVNHGK